VTDFTDTQRLDWLTATRNTVYLCSHQERRALTTPGLPHFELVYVHDGWAVLTNDDPSATPREAIDKAMAACGLKGDGRGD
jgi:hypothetical protein